MTSPEVRAISSTILLADDDVQLADFLSKSLESEGYSVHTAPNEGTVVEELRRQNYQLIILDLNFGQTDGLQLLERLRSQGLETPVIVLSARNRVTDRIQSLNLGADDYVTKPFSFQELSARANALLRRKADPSLSVLRIETLELDPVSHKVHRGHRQIKLSPREFDLLHLLMRRGGDTVSRHELLKECWGQQSETDSNLVDVYVNYLRRKVDLPEEEKLIYTVRGSGYRLGKPASGHATELADSSENLHCLAGQTYSPQSLVSTEAMSVHQMPLRALTHSLAHDLAQPLTSVRCYLEMLSMRGKNISPDDAELKSVEQQADRAIVLTKGISAMMREPALPADPWISLDSLFNDVVSDFVVLQNSGLLVLERQLQPSTKVTSNPVLRQLCILILSKLVGKNSSALRLTITAMVSSGFCDISFTWKPSGAGETNSAKSIFGGILPHIHEMLNSIGGEITGVRDQPEITLRVPAGPAGATMRH
jgi:two-component system OmpR family response regulator